MRIYGGSPNRLQTPITLYAKSIPNVDAAVLIHLSDSRYGVSEESIYDNTDHGDDEGGGGGANELPAENPDDEYELPNVAEARSAAQSRQESQEEELYAAPTLAKKK
jgi:hypothetical protein